MNHQQLITEVASHLDGWHYDEDFSPHQHTLTHPDYPNARLYLHITQNGARLSIDGDYARAYLYTRTDTPTITVSITRTPAQIAADIQRRFLPAYLRIWQQCEDNRREMEEIFKRVNGQLAALAYFLKTANAKWTPMELNTTGMVYFQGGRIRANFHDFEARLDALTYEQLLQIVHVLTARPQRWRVPTPYTGNSVRITFYTHYHTYLNPVLVPVVVIEHKHRTTYYFNPTPETLERLTPIAQRFEHQVINPNGWSAWKYYSH